MWQELLGKHVLGGHTGRRQRLTYMTWDCNWSGAMEGRCVTQKASWVLTADIVSVESDPMTS